MNILSTTTSILDLLVPLEAQDRTRVLAAVRASIDLTVPIHTPSRGLSSEGARDDDAELTARQAVAQAAKLARQALMPNLAADLEEVNRLLDRDSPDEPDIDDDGLPVRVGDVWRHRFLRLGERVVLERSVLYDGWRMTPNPDGEPVYMSDDCHEYWTFVRRGQPGVSPALQGPVDEEFEAHINKEIKR